jgi:hypothetical protein
MASSHGLLVAMRAKPAPLIALTYCIFWPGGGVRPKMPHFARNRPFAIAIRANHARNHGSIKRDLNA